MLLGRSEGPGSQQPQRFRIDLDTCRLILEPSFRWLIAIFWGYYWSPATNITRTPYG